VTHTDSAFPIHFIQDMAYCFKEFSNSCTEMINTIFCDPHTNTSLSLMEHSVVPVEGHGTNINDQLPVTACIRTHEVLTRLPLSSPRKHVIKHRNDSTWTHRWLVMLLRPFGMPLSVSPASSENRTCGQNDRLVDVHIQRSAGKLMLTLFWDHNGPILEHYMPRGSPVTSATYSNLLRENLKPAIRQKWRGLLMTGVCLLHDSAKPHTATAGSGPEGTRANTEPNARRRRRKDSSG